ncbi:hypothetical protein Gotur_021679 [Gossypium turneri]
MLKRNFHPKQRISLSQQQDLGKQVYKAISKLKWENFCTHPGSYSPSLQRGIVPRDGEEVLENKGPINKASIKRMIHGKDTPILKEPETSKTRKVTEDEKEKEEEDSIMNIVTAPESVGVNINNLEQDGARPAEVTEVTNEEQCNLLAVMIASRIVATSDSCLDKNLKCKCGLFYHLFCAGISGAPQDNNIMLWNTVIFGYLVK